MSRGNRAFTLMELLVVVAIVGLLVGLVVVSMRTVRASATRSESLGALRQMAVAHTRYSDEHRGRLLPGYIGSDLFALGRPFEKLVVSLPDGTELDPLDSQSYVWRLAPYVDDAWLTFFGDVSSVIQTQFVAEHDSGIYGPFGAGDPVGGISARPAYGLNSIFVGGDSVHGGAYAMNRNPWTGTQEKIAATRLSEVKNPSRLVVFAPTALAGASADDVYADPQMGYCELRPPYLELTPTSETWALPQWTVGVGGRVQHTTDGVYTPAAGLPIARSGKELIPVAHLDGSSVVVEISKLWRDMRRWNAFEVALHATAGP